LRGKDQYPSRGGRQAAMTHIDALTLAAVQSVTEFIPVSSSGHLVIFSKILGTRDVPLLFDLVLHLGTLTAVVVVYAGVIGEILRDVVRGRSDSHGVDRETEDRRRGNVKLFWFIILSTAVTGFFGFPFREPIESFFGARNGTVPLFLLVTGAILLCTRFFPDGKKGIGDFGAGFPVLIGIAQAIALLPGVSRSGTTIAAGLAAGASRKFAGLYSFLLSIPSVLGATAAEYLITHGSISGSVSPSMYMTAYIVSALVGYGALRILLVILERGRLFAFSFYCFTAGIAGYLFMNR
jgi:undecaprenyl-diphosphatase